MQLYRVEHISGLNFSATNWTEDSHEIKKIYEQLKIEITDGFVRIVTIEI